MSFGDTTKKAGLGVLNVTSRVAIAMWNGHREDRIAKIDEAIKELQEERAQLVSELITKDDLEK